MRSRQELRRDEGESDGQPDTENNQQYPSNLAIPAMAVGPATPDYQLNFSQLSFSRFRLILQLLPTFGVWFPGLSTERHLAALLCAVRGPSADAHPHQNAEDAGSDDLHANRQCSPLHKICPGVANIQTATNAPNLPWRTYDLEPSARTYDLQAALIQLGPACRFQD